MAELAARVEEALRGDGAHGAAADAARAERRSRCRCRSRSSGCGSWISSSRGAPLYNMPGGGAADGRAGRGGAGAELRRAGAPARGAAHDVPRRGRASRSRSSARSRCSPLPVVDLRGAAGGGARGGGAAAGRGGGAASVRPGSGARCCGRRCCSVGEREHVLVLVMHHIVSDGWSHGRPGAGAGGALRGVLRGQAVAAAGAAGAVRGLRGLAAGVAARARCWRRSSATGASSLAGAPPALELPTDRPRPAVQTLPGRAARRCRCRRSCRRRCSELAQPRGRDAVHGAAGGVPGAAARATRGRRT